MANKKKILEDEASFRIRMIQKTYNEFQKEIDVLKEKQDILINKALEQKDKSRIKDILKNLRK